MKKITFLKFILVFGLISFVYNTKSEVCEKDSECIDLNHCDMKLKKCVHDKIFSKIWKEILGLFFIMLGSALSNAGGIGGGGLLIPVLLLILNFYTHEAIPISKLMIFTGALTSFILGFRQKHPTRNSITIDYNIPLLLVPMLLFGTMVGVTLNKVTPPWIILVSLTIVLVINTYKTAKKGLKLYRDENKRVTLNRNDIETKGISFEERNQISNEGKNFFETQKVAKNNSVLTGVANEISSINESQIPVEVLAVEEEKDLKKFPLNKIQFMILCYIVMLIINFLKGTEYVNSLIGVEL